jgi:hypothetical protein
MTKVEISGAGKGLMEIDEADKITQNNMFIQQTLMVLGGVFF